MFNLTTCFMKKLFFFGIICVLAFLTTFLCCNKNDQMLTLSGLSNSGDDTIKQNEATWIYEGQNQSKATGIRLKIFIGHTADQCGGKCIKIFGHYGHIDCRGFGYVCNFKGKGKVLQAPDSESFMLTLSPPNIFGNDLDFDFPDRSIFITNPQNNEELWLNIPEQFLERSDTTECYTVRDAWFSENPELKNW